MANPQLINGVGSPQSIYTPGTTQYHAIGTKGIMQDGRVFYYARNGTTTALTRGALCVQAVPIAHHINQTVAAASDFTVGKTTVTANLAGTLAGQGVYDEGFCILNDDTGEGYSYKIRNNPGAAASTDMEFELYDGIVVGAGAATSFSLIQNAYSNTIASPTTVATPAVGVPVGTFAAAESAATATAAAVGATYGWMQTYGEAAVLADEAVAQALDITMGTGVAGAIELKDALGEISLGHMAQPGIDTEYQLAYLRIRA
jgi:hypothetical protein